MRFKGSFNWNKSWKFSHKAKDRSEDSGHSWKKYCGGGWSKKKHDRDDDHDHGGWKKAFGGWSKKHKRDDDDNDHGGWKKFKKHWSWDKNRDDKRRCHDEDKKQDDKPTCGTDDGPKDGLTTVTIDCGWEPPVIENHAPTIVSPTPAVILANTRSKIDFVGQVTAEDLDGDKLVFSIVEATGEESADADMFLIDPATGTLRFSQDIVAGGSADGDSTFEIEVMVTDGQATDTIELDVIYVTGA